MISFQHDDIRVLNDTIVVHFGDSVIEPEILQTGNFSKDIMKDAPFIDTFGEIHFLDSYFLGLVNIRVTRINNPISPTINLLPILIARNISKHIGQQLQQPLPRQIRLNLPHQLPNNWNNGFVILMVKMKMKDVEDVGFAVGYGELVAVEGVQ